MSWVFPRVWAVGEEVTAAKLNEVSAALNDLDHRTSAYSAGVAALESTASATFTDLTTPGPAVPVTIGSTGKAMVALHCRQYNSISGDVSLMAIAISGATILAASDPLSLTFVSPIANGDVRHGTCIEFTTLFGGPTTFTLKYRATPAGTAVFETRLIAVTPLGS